jgi:transposase-like protein
MAQSKRTQRTYPAQLKTKVVLEALKEEKDINTIATEHDLNPKLIYKWRKEFLENASSVFEEPARKQDEKRKEKKVEAERDVLLKKIGQLTVERDYLRQSCEDLGVDPEAYRTHPW